MLIDDLRALNINCEGKNIRDAIVFRIDMHAKEFGGPHAKHEMGPLPSFLPYDNIVIQFNDFVAWYFSLEPYENELCIISSFCSTTTLSDKSEFNQYQKNGVPQVVFSSKIDLVTRECKEQDVYYPCIKQFDNARGANPSTVGLRTVMLLSYDYLRIFLNILSCKNIKTELEAPDEKIQKKRAAKGKLPLVSFYTLKIQNIGHNAESTSSGLWSNRVHFCRGHMREYTSDAPLFGRIVGRFWIPPHVRGDKNKGIIIKDYEVNTSKKPQEES